MTVEIEEWRYILEAESKGLGLQENEGIEEDYCVAECIQLYSLQI